MVRKVEEVSKLSGVSKRTLQYYDDEGILPAKRSKENYRLYDEVAMEKLWEILWYKEMGFQLPEIKEILVMPKREREEYFEKKVRSIGEKIQDLEEHQWKNATCTEPQICSVCNETKGEKLGHDPNTWATIKEATCTAVGEKETTCKRCGKSLVEEIGMADHIAGEWTVVTDYKINRDGTVTPGTQAEFCTVCNTKLETKEYTIELTNNQKNAIIRAYEEENSWHVSRDYLINDILVGFDYFNVEDATFAVDHMDVNFDEQAVAYVRSNLSGQSKGEVTEMMRYYGYTEEQINNAFEKAGF